MTWLRQSTAVTIPLGPFVDAADGNTPETALTIAQADIRLSKNGGTYAQSNNAAGATHLEGGEYGVPLNATDTDTLGRLKVRVHVAGALPVWAEFQVVPAQRYDALVQGNDLLDVEVAAMAANSVTAAAIQDGALTSAKLADGLLTAAKFAAGAFDAVWSVATRLLTGGANIVLAKGTGITGFNDLSAAEVNAQADQALVDAGVTPTAMGRLDVAVSSRSTVTEAQVNAQADQALVDAGVTPTVMGRLDVAVSSRSTLDAITALDAIADAIKAKTDLLPADPAGRSDVPTAVQNADALLGRSIAGGVNGGRTVTSALRRVRNRLAIAAGTLTVYREDDTTVDHTAAVTTAAGDPISEIDPA